jgi:hypothetical protein
MASAESRRDSWREAGHASTPGPARGDHAGSKVWWFGLKNHQGGRFSSLGLKTGAGARCGWAAQEGFSVWASKPRMALDAVEWPGGFDGLASKPSSTRVSRF